MDPNVSFPLTGINEDGMLNWSTDSDSVREVIWNILLTEPGERLMRPEFGAGLNRYIHYPNNETTRRLIADVSLNALRRWEPRIDILELTATSRPDELNQVTVTVIYRTRATGAEDTLQLGLQLGF
ncbi:MAG: GPW/gp25 family protein [Reinekea sp.]